MKRPSNSFAVAACLAFSASLAGCGSSSENRPPDFAFQPGPSGQSGGDGGYGYGNPHSDAGTPPDMTPVCDEPERLCAHAFSYTCVYNGGSGPGPCSIQPDSVSVHGTFDNWGAGVPMTYASGSWTATVDLAWGANVSYKFVAQWGSASPVWTADPNNPNTDNDGNSLLTNITCDHYTCGLTPQAGVFDWRDAVIYFVFVDRFLDGNSSNNCNVSGTETTSYTSTNYLGGDWAGVTQKINDGYFNDLGVNTLWLTVPIKNADDVAGEGVGGDTHMYSSYHGYWPKDPNATEDCFGSAQDLKDLVAAAHAKNLKVLFDYAMVHVHTESSIYQTHKNDGWFTPTGCICDTCGNYNTTCWFADYLAHYDYSNSAACTFSVNAAISLIQNYGNDAFRLDAIKQVHPNWMAMLRPAIASQVTANETPQQRFYMVGETYDFQNRALIRSLIDPTNQLDGQFDFPLRIRLIEALLMRSAGNLLTPDDTSWSRNAPPGMTGLSQFMDSNDSFYPYNAVMSTFIGNHDLPRSIHYAEDSPLWSDSATDGKNLSWSSQPQTSTNSRAYERMANAFAVLMTNRGAPLIYYGDEIGLPGAGDPDNRRMMQWSGYNTYQQGLHDRIAALGAIRAAHPALRYGERQTLSVSTDLWLYEMTTTSPTADTVYVAINRSDGDLSVSALPSGALNELLTSSTVTGPNATIPPRQTRIYVAQ